MIWVETFDGYKCVKCKEYSVIRTVYVEPFVAFSPVYFSSWSNMKIRGTKTVCMNCFCIAVDDSLLATKEVMFLDGTRTVYDQCQRHFIGLEVRKRRVISKKLINLVPTGDICRGRAHEEV